MLAVKVLLAINSTQCKEKLALARTNRQDFVSHWTRRLEELDDSAREGLEAEMNHGYTTDIIPTYH